MLKLWLIKQQILVCHQIFRMLIPSMVIQDRLPVAFLRVYLLFLIVAVVLRSLVLHRIRVKCNWHNFNCGRIFAACDHIDLKNIDVTTMITVKDLFKTFFKILNFINLCRLHSTCWKWKDLSTTNYKRSFKRRTILQNCRP
jgi:hypothetical protein